MHHSLANSVDSGADMAACSIFQASLVRLITAASAILVVGWSPAPVMGQTCGTDYIVRDGDTLGQIAARVYGNPSLWTVIFYSNQDRLGTNATLVVPGLSIRLPCVGGTQAGAAIPAPSTSGGPTAAPLPSAEPAFMLSSMVRRIEFLTADGYQPYTGRAIEGGGMLTQVLSASMDLIKEEAKGRFDYGISWVNDWAAHLNPLLLTRAFDVGFPWARPNCEKPTELDVGSQFRCEKFHFSDPLHEVVTQLFVLQQSRIKSLRTEELSGTSICRPSGYSIIELDQGGRNWLKDGKVTLIRPPTSDDCFRLLESGSVDSVMITELVGRSSINSLGLGERVRYIDAPVALGTLHVVVSKSHPNARTLLYYVNAGVSKLRESGEYDRIVDRHLTRFWQSQVAVPSPTLATTPAARPIGGAAPPASPAAAAPATKEPAKATTPAISSTAITSTAKSDQPTGAAK
jgi:polar amino acid transport system substrate-binding protein